jgi:anti-sigma-K factor RskA
MRRPADIADEGRTLRYRDKPELQERLAAEYVLGTLRGPARARFLAWMREDAALARTVREWEARLNPMTAAIAEVRPPRRVWRAIEARVASAGRSAAPATATSPARPRASLWESLAFWRNWALVASGLAAALALGIGLQRPAPPEDRFAMQPSYVAMVQDSGRTMKVMAFVPRGSAELWIKTEGMQHEPGKSYELWALSARPGQAPVSLGVLPSASPAPIRLAAVAERTLADVPWLAVSVEPEGGSRTGQPTGPVIAKGDCLRFW